MCKVNFILSIKAMLKINPTSGLVDINISDSRGPLLVAGLVKMGGKLRISIARSTRFV